MQCGRPLLGRAELPSLHYEKAALGQLERRAAAVRQGFLSQPERGALPERDGGCVRSGSTIKLDHWPPEERSSGASGCLTQPAQSQPTHRHAERSTSRMQMVLTGRGFVWNLPETYPDRPSGRVFF